MSEGGECMHVNCMFDWQRNTTAVAHSFEGAHSCLRKVYTDV